MSIRLAYSVVLCCAIIFSLLISFRLFFFFQAEDGIRDSCCPTIRGIQPPHNAAVPSQPTTIALRTLRHKQVRGLGLRIYRKEGDQVQLIAFPDEHVQRGDYLLIEDPGLAKGLLVQIIDLQYANVPGILEDILRDVMTDGELSGEDMDPLNISSEVDALKDTRLAVCKIRGTITGEKDLSPTASCLPSRTASRIRAYPINRLIMNS